MIPPGNVPSVPYGMQSNAHQISQQMQDLALGPPPAGMNMNQAAYPPPQQRPHATSVTYSGSPQATYPYNSPQSLKSPVNSLPPPPPPQNNHQDMKATGMQQRFYPDSPIRNGVGQSNGNMDPAKDPMQSSPFQQGPPPLMSPKSPQQYQTSNSLSNPPTLPLAPKDQIQSSPYQAMSQRPAAPQNYQPPGPNSPLNAPTFPPATQMQSSPLHQHQGPYQSMPPRSAVNAGPQQYPPPANLSSPPRPGGPELSPMNAQSPMQSSYPSSPLQSSPPQYSAMPPSPPNQGGGWPNQQQYPGVGTPGNYMHGQQPMRAPNQAPGTLDQTPSIVTVREEDQKNRGGCYVTDTKGQKPPMVTSDFTVQDRGLCNPRFIRSTVYCLPNNPDMLKQTAIPFALTLCPMALLNKGETDPPLALWREGGPLRCKRCKAYMCPYMTFIEGGRSFQCAFCKVSSEVPQDYFAFLDNIGERTDKYHRPELCLGSYEFLATKEYCRNDELPNPPAYIFMIEVSNATFRNGLVPLLCENMKSVLQCLKNDENIDSSKMRVGFVSYNNVLHFYNMKKNLTQPHIMVLSDVHNAFVPLCDGFLVTLSEAEALVDCLMEHIPRLFVNEPATEVILGPVVQVGMEALKNANCSGKLLIFHSSIPNADAPGKLPHREGQKLLGTDKQKSVLTPQNDFYYKLAQECVAVGCAVDLFLFPSSYVDVASMAPLCRHTGGQMYKYTYFQSHIDGDRFLSDLERNITTPTAFDAVLRVRTSAGISPIFYYGNFYMSNNTDVELCAVDSHKATTIEMAYDDKLPENETVVVQAALLYTSVAGERRIRVHNLAIPTSVGMPDLYNGCELDTMVNYFAKQAIKQVLEMSPQQIKSHLVSTAAKMLSCYRKHCCHSTAPSQLLLAESLKLLPLYVNCLLKSDAIMGGSEMSLDDRSFAMLAVNTMDVRSTALYFYPSLIPLHDIQPDSDTAPTRIRCAAEKLCDNGAYLLENGIYMLLWIGQAVSSEWLQGVFGVSSVAQVDKQLTTLPEVDTPLSKKIIEIVEDLEVGRQWCMRLRIVVQGDKLEAVFRQFLVEDRGIDGSASYPEFLCHLHREISQNL